MDYPLSTAVGHTDDQLPIESEIESLVRETRAPHEIVRKLYTTERAKLERTAKIKTYVPVLIRRHVRELLQVQGR